MKLRITDGKGTHVEMGNGIVLSVQIGPGNYCDNYDEPFSAQRDPKYRLPASRTAEIAVWFKGDGELMDLPSGDTVAGRVDIGKILKIIPKLDALESPTPEVVCDILRSIIVD